MTQPTHDEKVALVEKAKGIVGGEVANDQLRLWHLENTGGLLTEIHKAQTKLNLSLAHKAYFERHRKVANNNCMACSQETDWEYEREYPCPESVTTADLIVNGTSK